MFKLNRRSTFLKCGCGLCVQPFLPHFCNFFINEALACRELALGVVIVITQGRVHLSV